MIKSLKLRNFKSFDYQDIELGILTLLSGLNGQGKSTVLQALLLLRQSYQQGVITFDTEQILPYGPRLILNGDLVQLGTGQDVYFEGGQQDTIEFEITWVDNLIGKLACKYKTDDDVLDVVKMQGFDSISNALFGNGFQYLQAERFGPRIVSKMSNFQVREREHLGTRGEYTTHYLSSKANEKISNEVMAHPDARSLALIHQVEAWLSEICPGTHLNFTFHTEVDLVSLQYSFTTTTQVSRPYRATNVGFGITYTLPVLVAILSAHPGNLLLLENPEAHLHPKGQSQIGNLMARAASCGVQIIVETHSDHVLNGVRVAVRNGVLSPSNVKLHFFERQELDNIVASTQIISPQIDRNGRITPWPDGFFDEWDKSLEALLLPPED